MHIREFQEIMRRLYLHRDSERGAKEHMSGFQTNLKNWKKFLKETTKKQPKKSLQTSLPGLRLLRTTVIDLERAAVNKYNGKCQNANSPPANVLFNWPDVSALNLLTPKNMVVFLFDLLFLRFREAANDA